MDDKEIVVKLAEMGVATFTEVWKVIKEKREADDNEIKVAVSKFREEILKPFEKYNCIDVLHVLCDNDDTSKEVLYDLYLKITNFCKDTSRNKKIRNNVAAEDLSEDLFTQKIYHKLCLISAYFKTTKDENYEYKIEYYKKLGEEMSKTRPVLKRVFERKNANTCPEIIRDLGLEIGKKHTLKRIPDKTGPIHLCFNSSNSYIISKKQNCFCKVSIDKIAEESGLMVWAMGNDVIYINETNNVIEYLKRVNSISPSKCKKNSKNISSVKLNRYLTLRDDISYRIVRFTDEYGDNIKYMVRLYLKALTNFDFRLI